MSLLNYEVKRKKGSKRLRISVHQDRKVVVTLPDYLREIDARNFVKQKIKWIQNSLKKMRKTVRILPIRTKRDFISNKEKAGLIVRQKIDYFNKFYKLKIEKITIRNQRSRWGSCSKKGNLNFNYQLIYLPEKQIDYLIVHELCHIKFFNHSHLFWESVRETIPDYKEVRKKLKKII